MASKRCAITTIDNPFSPFDDFDSWYNYDMLHGYNSCGFLAKLAKTSPEYPQPYNEQIIEEAIDEIVKIDPTGLYKKVTTADF